MFRVEGFGGLRSRDQGWCLSGRGGEEHHDPEPLTTEPDG